MNNRRVVRTPGRPVYGRPQAGQQRGRRPSPWLGLLRKIPRRVIVLIAAILGVLLLLQQIFNISMVNVKSTDRGPQIKAEVQRLIAVVPRQRNLLTLDPGELEAALLKADPMIKEVAIHRQWPQSLQLTITLKQPSLGWMSGNQAYLLDRDGSAIGALPAGSAVPVVVDGSNLPVELGRRVTSTRFVAFTVEVARQLAALKIAPTRYEVKDTTLDLYVTHPKGYRLIFDTSRTADEQMNDLRALLGFLSKQNKTPAEYVDLRIAGKAYYK